MKNLQNRTQVVPVNPKTGFRTHLLVFLLVSPALWLIWILTGNSYPWPIWSTPAWAIGVLFHYLGVFVFKKPAYAKASQLTIERA